EAVAGATGVAPRRTGDRVGRAVPTPETEWWAQPTLRMDAAMTLTDQVALVTGGSRGIGRAVVLALAGAGAKVAFVYRGSKEAADSLVADVTAAGGTVLAQQGDVADPATAPRCVGEVLEKWGRLDILVNNAGVI